MHMKWASRNAGENQACPKPSDRISSRCRCMCNYLTIQAWAAAPHKQQPPQDRSGVILAYIPKPVMKGDALQTAGKWGVALCRVKRETKGIIYRRHVVPWLLAQANRTQPPVKPRSSRGQTPGKPWPNPGQALVKPRASPGVRRRYHTSLFAIAATALISSS